MRQWWTLERAPAANIGPSCQLVTTCLLCPNIATATGHCNALHKMIIHFEFLFQEVALYVVMPPMFINTSESQMRMMVNAPATLFCHAKGMCQVWNVFQSDNSGEPKPTVTWRRSDGKTINLQHRVGQTQVQGPVLHLADLSPQDAGDYLCVAKNDHPPAIVKTIKVNVMCKLWNIETFILSVLW